MPFNNQDKVLVIGVSGFVGAHVLRVLLEHGYWVRGTVRSERKADQIKAKYPQFKGKLDLVLVDDIAKDGAFDRALQGIDGVFHVASPFHMKSTDNKRDVLDPAIRGTRGILESALKVPSVKRIVITSSYAAVLDYSKANTGYAFTEKDWNPVTYEQAVNGDAFIGYVGSKKLAEKAAYDFLEEKRPHFDIVTICPPFILGPFEHHVDKLSELNESAAQFYAYLEGKKPAHGGFDLFVDVRDVAKAQWLAYQTPEASNQRYLISNNNFSWQEVVDFAHQYFPGQTKADVGQPGAPPPPTWNDDSSKSRTQLKLTYIPKIDTFRDQIAQIVEFQKAGKI